jgi:RecB family exonuclease
MDFSGYDLILTPNHRLSASLKSSVPVYSLSQWLEKAFLESQSSQTLLNPHQQLWIIKSIIKDHYPEFLGLAPLIQSAWRLTHQYFIDPQSALYNKNDDTQLFQLIATAISSYYETHRFIDMELFTSCCVAPAKTALVGFQKFTPLEEKLLGHCTRVKLNRPAKKTIKTIYPDIETELKTMVLWACSQPKELQVACVIPNLEENYDKINYYFDYILADSKAYTISPVKKLSDYYFIQDIFNLFLPNEDLLKPSEWADYFQSRLNQSGFLEKRALNTEEFQLSEKLKDIFKLYKNHDLITQKLNFDDAILELHNLCSRIPFQPTASKTANIHILSLLESKGLLFDKLWVTGMDSRHWPNKSPQNPFLPFPHITINNYNFLESADEVILSYPQQAQDQTLIPSDLLKNINLENINLTWVQPSIGRSFVAEKTAPQDDSIAPRVNIDLLNHRGSQIFKDHIACPFRAFAKHRLNAQKKELPQLGFTALQRGNLVHEVLEKIFTVIKSQKLLLDYSQEKLAELTNTIINNSLIKYTKNTQHIFILAEKTRLERLVLEWLELEKSREDFIVVATEKTIETHLGKLPLKLRIDRIDQIGENKYLIIDYKTSQYDIRGDYLDEPQLPLYSVISGISVDSIAYAYLRTGNSKLKQIPVKDMKNQWEHELIKIADDFLSGNAKVQPKYGEETCRMCDLKSLCRINCHSERIEETSTT